MVLLTTSDGVRLAVYDLGNGKRRPVVFAHGMGLHGLVWIPLIRDLGSAFHCYAFDARGHGDSGPPPAGDFDWRGLGRDVVSVVSGLGLRRPCAVGHSSGATALLLAEQAQPGTFDKIYCFEPVMVPADPPLGVDSESWLAAQARRRPEVFASRDDAYEYYASRPSFAAVAPSALRAYIDHGLEEVADGTVRLKCRRESEALFYEMATVHDCFVRLREVSCPVMLSCGKRTEVMTGDIVRTLAARLPKVHSEVVPGVGHLGPMESPGAVAASIRRFFGSRAGTSGSPGS